MRRRAKARTRVMVSFAVGAVAAALSMLVWPWQVTLLVAWEAAAATMIGWVLPIILRTDGPGTAALAMREDDSRVAADILLVSASAASLVGVAFGLIKGAHEHGTTQAAITAVAVLSVVLSWAVVQLTFTLRYARLYYGAGCGIDFNSGPDSGSDGEADPDFRDFAYLALTIGMTYQVSDTNLTTKQLRRTATRHALLSYVFGTAVVAVMINVVAGLVK
jgi:uncharacterized membrane protein